MPQPLDRSHGASGPLTQSHHRELPRRSQAPVARQPRSNCFGPQAGLPRPGSHKVVGPASLSSPRGSSLWWICSCRLRRRNEAPFQPFKVVPTLSTHPKPRPSTARTGQTQPSAPHRCRSAVRGEVAVSPGRLSDAKHHARRTDAAEDALRHRDRDPLARARHRRECRDLLALRPDPAATAAGARARPSW